MATDADSGAEAGADDGADANTSVTVAGDVTPTTDAPTIANVSVEFHSNTDAVGEASSAAVDADESPKPSEQHEGSAAAPSVESILATGQVEPELRSQESINEIVEFVREVPFLKSLTCEQQQNLSRRMTVEFAEKNEYLFRQGDPGHKFYVVLSGGASVQIWKGCPTGIPSHACSQSCDCLGSVTETAEFLGPGGSFGELVLQSDCLRQASVQASDNTSFLVVCREDYERVAGDGPRRVLGRRVEFLKQCDRICEAYDRGLIKVADIFAIANCLTEVPGAGDHWGAHDVAPQVLVIKQGDPLDALFFVHCGRLAMLRLVDVPPASLRGLASAVPEGNSLTPTTADGESRLEEENSDADALENEKNTDHGEDFDDMDESHGLRISTCEDRVANAMLEMKRKERMRLLESINGVPNQGGVEKRTASKKSRACSKSSTTASSISSPNFARRLAKRSPQRRLLRVGTLGAYQIFGAKQLSAGEPSPVSLVTDPVAEVLTIAKYDLMRKVPKSALNVLLDFDVRSASLEPNDAQLMQLQRHTRQWCAFRKDIHAQACSGRRASRPSLREDSVRKLQFLGVDVEAEPTATRALISTPRTPGRSRELAITERDSEHFGAVSARFMRQLSSARDAVENTSSGVGGGGRGVNRRAKGRLGELGGPGRVGPSRQSRKEAEVPSAISARFEQHWCAVDLEHVLGLDAVLGKALEDRGREETSKTAGGGSHLGGTDSNVCSGGNSACSNVVGIAADDGAKAMTAAATSLHPTCNGKSSTAGVMNRTSVPGGATCTGATVDDPTNGVRNLPAVRLPTVPQHVIRCGGFSARQRTQPRIGGQSRSASAALPRLTRFGDGHWAVAV
eukprot:TRINITY_DN15508_c0_g1_i3.p1 TRINITY_DN15508_c0_g1~~TRINITY_DN15508_c0_g1_i3.p1  ORF type:complete len:860 (-),score=170.58 TRINITY_DN15508_c0_g1_i3:69-2624(-)